MSLLTALKLPLALLVFFSTLYAVWLLLDLPPEETLAPIARSYFERYGVLTIFVAALIEGIFVIGWYFPGSTIIVICLVIATDQLLPFTTSGIAAGTGLSLAYIVNYLLGRHGWYRALVRLGFKDSIENGKRRLLKYGLSAVFLSYWQFGLASTVSTAAGVLQVSFARFALASSAAAAAWTALYCTLIYALGPAAMQLVGIRVILAIVVLWILFAAVTSIARRRRVQKKS